MCLQTSYDALTLLPDRLSFLEHLQNELEYQSGNQRQSALLLIDVDDFSGVNQRLGQAVGDQVLKLVVDRIRDTMRDHELLARFNGDELVLLVSDVGDISTMESLADRLLRLISKPYQIEGNTLKLHCNIGITLFTCDGRDANDVLLNVDTALNRAKKAGKNSYRHFAVEMNASVRRRVEISNALLAMTSDMPELHLVYQPKLDLALGGLTGVEALLRWDSEALGEISPVEFIPIAEQNGMIIPIGEWVLLQACQQAVDWKEQHNIEIGMAVNLSAKQFRDINLPRIVTDILERTGLSPSQLELELTESMLMHDIHRTVSTLHELKKIGVGLALDDFGTGYSSLSYLKDFPLDYLKIDRSFVAHVPEESKEKAIVQTVISMAHLLDLKVIAEGVETSEQLKFLLAQDCDEMQGYLLSRPVKAKAIVEMIEHKKEMNNLSHVLYPY